MMTTDEAEGTVYYFSLHVWNSIVVLQIPQFFFAISSSSTFFLHPEILCVFSTLFSNLFQTPNTNKY